LQAREQIPVKKMQYTYVLKSEKDGKLYIGCTSDVDKRLVEHNSGKVEATRTRTLFRLVYFEGCLDKQKAFEREKYFKTGFGRRYLTNRM
jgi:putative endonuclease